MSKRKILLSLLFIIHLFIPVLFNLDPQAGGLLMTYGRLTGLAKRWNFFSHVFEAEYILYFTGDGKKIPENISRDNWPIQNFVNGNHIDFYAKLAGNPELLQGYMKFLCKKFHPGDVKAELIVRPFSLREEARVSGTHVKGPERREIIGAQTCL